MVGAVQKNDADSTASACQGEWIRILGQLKAEVGEDAYRNWLRPINLERVDDGQAVIAAPTRFLRDWVRTHYADRLLALWQAENERMTRVSVVVAAYSRYPNDRHPRDRGDDADTPQRILLGTSPACGIILTDPTISRRHAAFEPAGSRYRLTDLDSKNGTFVDGTAIVQAYVRGGETVRVGSTALALHAEAAPPPATLSTSIRFGQTLRVLGR